jgi:hypothetical protein
MVLIQLCFHSPWRDLQKEEDLIQDPEYGALLSNRFTASRVARGISAEEGLTYQNAVEYCVEWADLEENQDASAESFQQGIYDNVLAPLREELANYGPLTSIRPMDAVKSAY